MIALIKKDVDLILNIQDSEIFFSEKNTYFLVEFFFQSFNKTIKCDFPLNHLIFYHPWNAYKIYNPTWEIFLFWPIAKAMKI